MISSAASESGILGTVRGRSSVVERQLPKLNVEGSSPFARFGRCSRSGSFDISAQRSCTHTVHSPDTEPVTSHRGTAEQWLDSAAWIEPLDRTLAIDLVDVADAPSARSALKRARAEALPQALRRTNSRARQAAHCDRTLDQLYRQSAAHGRTESSSRASPTLPPSTPRGVDEPGFPDRGRDQHVHGFALPQQIGSHDRAQIGTLTNQISRRDRCERGQRFGRLHRADRSPSAPCSRRVAAAPLARRCRGCSISELILDAMVRRASPSGRPQPRAAVMSVVSASA